MGVLEKIIGVAMLGLSALILLEEFKIYSISLPFDKILIGAILMIILQIFNIIMLKITGGEIDVIHFITAIIFIAPAAAYLVSVFFIPLLVESLPIILGVMMIAEGIYAMH